MQYYATCRINYYYSYYSLFHQCQEKPVNIPPHFPGNNALFDSSGQTPATPNNIW